MVLCIGQLQFEEVEIVQTWLCSAAWKNRTQIETEIGDSSCHTGHYLGGVGPEVLTRKQCLLVISGLLIDCCFLKFCAYLKCSHYGVPVGVDTKLSILVLWKLKNSEMCMLHGCNPELRRIRLEDGEFEANLDYISRHLGSGGRRIWSWRSTLAP